MATVHLHNPNTARFDEFVNDSEWAGAPFWMLNTFAYHAGDAAAEANRAYGNSMQGILSDVGARIVMQARVARTVIGERSWEAAAVVEYPSLRQDPESLERLAAVADAYLELRPDWGEVPTREISELELKHLRALGYAIP